MLTTIIYRSHLCDDVPVKALESMVAAANLTNGRADVTGILLFNGTHFFQLLEGPDENVKAIYQAICEDKRHYNVVELLCDHGPSRRFGKVGMELFDLREHDREEVLQTILDKGTSRYQLTYNDRALQFFRTFVEATEKENYFEIPPSDTWDFIATESARTIPLTSVSEEANCSFAFQPIIDPFAQEIVSLEALLRTRSGDSPQRYFDNIKGDDIYLADLESKKVAFTLATSLGLRDQVLSVNLLPMTLVKVPDAASYLLNAIADSGLVPEQIIVEFTEREVISEFEAFTETVRTLKSSGISIALDHFGAGFGGLRLLAQFQPDRIKINRDLICDVHKSGPRQAIIQAMIKCCASLEIAISAVGVEKPEEWMWLESAGISQFQGHLFAAPCFCGIPPVAWPEKKTPL
ncbi:diguanylate phosphodiesterase [Citrobacter amalonaticus]|uniref:Cyclic-di-GMP phosphodiesterase blue-light sensing protein using FAD (BLUF) n=1 Tax=Citrobacter amalonaticus TaxID=35703 RepID=A0AAW9LYE8_CITAM|nr:MULTISPECIES: diguanylate phosphodiesterase [Citrobacter]MDU1755286.1 diguanylate phosphodiesterase [Citrobacter sp.]ELR9583576.1 diguanylate phosphodiesterase [Citrobacter amalonaticus]MDV2135686.1 diguanylate phosphodiesterase [Citrobacter amalonaticus]MEB0583192.1 diguanylate phosphodiesterase [Citrobacter amalonaticus]QIO39450.1 diguanylate phosphodiesterase [Citrobacter sp. Y3]